MTGGVAFLPAILNFDDYNCSQMYFFSEYDNYRGAGGHITSDAESDFAHEDDSEVCSEIDIQHCPQI